jgi:predicted CXXCH cytochrome family protein
MRVGRRLLSRVAMPLVLFMAVTAALAAIDPAGTPARAVTTEAAERGPCIASPSVMRRTHMDMLKHDRTAAVHDGIRYPDRALENCIACHAVTGADGKAVTIEDKRHFCNSCHLRAAVSIDCFSCHRSTPAEGDVVVRPTLGSTTP